jgi:hypothetical protein
MLFSSCILVTLKFAAGWQTCRPSHAELGLKDWAIVVTSWTRNSVLMRLELSCSLSDRADKRESISSMNTTEGWKNGSNMCDTYIHAYLIHMSYSMYHTCICNTYLYYTTMHAYVIHILYNYACICNTYIMQLCMHACICNTCYRTCTKHAYVLLMHV